MIYVTGDMHGDLSRLKTSHASKIKKNDILIICGDFGFIWNNSKNELSNLKWLSKRNYTVLFVEGAHENYKLLEDYPVVEYMGAEARQIASNIYQLKRGNIYEIENKTIFAFGGGDDETMDLYDLPENSTFTRIPNNDEYLTAKNNLEKYNFSVDYFITYDISFKIRAFLLLDNTFFNSLHIFFEELSKTCTIKKWFFGRYHIDKIIPPKYYGVYSGIYDIETGKQL